MATIVLHTYGTNAPRLVNTNAVEYALPYETGIMIYWRRGLTDSSASPLRAAESLREYALAVRAGGVENMTNDELDRALPYKAALGKTPVGSWTDE